MAKPDTNAAVDAGHAQGDGVGYWLLNENTGTSLTNYLASPVADGTLDTGASWTTNDAAEPAVALDGTAAGWIDLSGIDEDALRQQGSMVIRLSLASANQGDNKLRALVGLGASSSNLNLIELRKITDNTVRARYRVGGTNYDVNLGAATTVFANGYAQLIFTWDVGAGGNDELKAWVDGTLAGTTDMTGVSSIATSLLNRLWVGKTPQGTSAAEATATVDYVFVFNRVLDPTTDVAPLASYAYSAFQGKAAGAASRLGMDGGPSPWRTISAKTPGAGLPGTTTLVAPADTATSVSLTMQCEWNATSLAETYDLQVDDTSDAWGSLVVNQTGISNLYYGATLAANTTHYWRVRGVNGSGNGAWSSTYSFTTALALPAAPGSLDPADQDADVSLNPSLSWGAVGGAISYDLELYGPQGLHDSISATDQTSFAPQTLEAATTYQWRVRTTDAVGTGAWSPFIAFSTAIDAPVLTGPADAATNQRWDLLGFFWTTVAAAQSYHVQVATDAGFSAIVAEDEDLGTPFLYLQSLTPGATLYWRVRSVGAGGITSAWTGTQSLTVTAYERFSTTDGEVLLLGVMVGGGSYAGGVAVLHDNVTVLRGSLYNYTGNGIYVDASVTGTKIYHCNAYNNAYGIYLLADGTVTNVALDNNSTADLYVDTGQTLTLSNSIVGSAYTAVTGGGTITEVAA